MFIDYNFFIEKKVQFINISFKITFHIITKLHDIEPDLDV